MRGRRWFVVAVLVMVGVPWSVPAGLLPALPSLSGEPGIFWTECGFSHRLADDPIVSPRKPGRSHSHDFFANRSTNAYSTHASLRAAQTLCHRSQDASAYWVPTLSQGGKALKPMGAIAYYLAGDKDPRSVRAFPAGLRLIAGNGKATGPQPTWIVSWGCSGSESRSGEPPVCGADSWLRLHLRFPDCWNGRDLDFADHKSHLTYASGGCPSSHPVAVPVLALAITYPTVGGPGITFSSGSRYTGHADFFNAWDQAELSRLVKECLNADRRCGRN